MKPEQSRRERERKTGMATNEGKGEMKENKGNTGCVFTGCR